MAISKIKTGSIEDGTLSTSDLADGAVTTAKIANGTIALADLSATGTASSSTFLRGDNSWQVVSVTPTAVSDQANSSTGYFDLPAGTTAQRPASPAVGMIRYNTTTAYYETYSASGWSSIATPPSIAEVSPTSFNGDSGEEFTITGSFFDSGATVKFITNAGTEYTAASVTFVSQTQILATTPQNFSVSDEPLDIKVINGSGLSATLENCIDCGGTPTWSTSAGSLGTIYEDTAISTITLSASDPEGGSVSYSVTSGSLPTGLSLNSSTGAITGTVNANGSYSDSGVTHNITVAASDGVNTTSRSFSLLRKFLTNKVDIFNDGSCKALYQFTQNANDTSGTYNGTGTDVSYSSGTNAGAYTSYSGYFNGTTSKITVDVPITTSSWAFSFWFYEDPSDSNPYKTIVSTSTWVSSGAPHDWGLRWDHGGSGRMGLIVRNVVDPFYFDNSATGYSSGWNHCVFQYTGTRYEFWKNGTLQPNTYTHASGSWKNWQAIMQSPWDGSAGYVKGSMDQLRFFNRVLTSSEITSLINEVNQQ